MLYLICAAAAALIIAADRLTKLWVVSAAEVGETIAGIPLFDFTYIQNKGAAFSMMSGRLGILSFVSLAVCAAVIAFFIIKRPKNRLLCASLALIFAGGLGNAWDRLVYGYVVDFIETTFIDFPVFNIADIAITTGAALLIIHEVFFDSDTKKKNTEQKNAPADKEGENNGRDNNNADGIGQAR
jgi:signal peptidase II